MHSLAPRPRSSQWEETLRPAGAVARITARERLDQGPRNKKSVAGEKGGKTDNGRVKKLLFEESSRSKPKAKSGRSLTSNLKKVAAKGGFEPPRCEIP